MTSIKSLTTIIGILFLSFFSACAESGEPVTTELELLTVYKSPTCGCCGKWIDQLPKADFLTRIEHPDDMNGVKNQYHIPAHLQSCHTAVSKDGFVFEGHIPARYIKQFLTAPPAQALGLAVPGMPAGSPGMEMGNSFTPYDIVLLKKNGSAEIFASVKDPSQQ